VLPSAAMSARWLLVVAGVAITGGIAWLLVRPGEGPTTAASRDAGVSPRLMADAPRIATPTPLPPTLVDAAVEAPDEAPALPALVEDAAPPVEIGEQAFDRETRDADWAPAKERELDRRLGRLDQRPGRVECRSRQCRMTFMGGEDALAKTMAVLDSTKGLQGFVENQLLSIVRQADGTMELRVYASFAR